MKVQNMTSNLGNKVANQFIVRDQERDTTCFQSYDSVICKVIGTIGHGAIVKLDSTYWDYSRTTGKYRNQFLGESKKETQSKIDSGEYILTNLN